jgi:IS5 family transposase
VYAFLADHRHQLFPAELFADVTRQGGGHPSVPAEVVATVMVLQALEGLSDREAVSALRRDIAWKVACGLRLDDEGFHPTVLVYWRNRIRRSSGPRRIFDAVRQVVEATGVLSGRGRRVLDTTILEDAVATQDTVNQLVAAIRRVRRLVPAAGQVKLAAHDYERPGKPDCVWDDPQAKQALVSGLVNDALAVLAAVADLGLGDEQAEAVALLALVAGQDVEPGDRPGSWQIARRVARDRVISTVDPQARHARKTSAARRNGYKGHIAAEPETGLVTQCALTAATAADGPTGVKLLAAEEPGLEVLGDSGYGSGPTRAALRARRPPPDDQAAAASQHGAGRVHHPRLPDRPAGWHGQVPCRPCRVNHQLGSGQLRPLVPALPAAPALHDRQAGAHDPPPSARGRVARCPSPSGDPNLPAKLSAVAADGGTLAGPAGRRRLPTGALPGVQRNDLWWSLRVAAVNLRRLLVLGLARRDSVWVLA